jgi:hypothetical protein
MLNANGTLTIWIDPDDIQSIQIGQTIRISSELFVITDINYNFNSLTLHPVPKPFDPLIAIIAIGTILTAILIAVIILKG